MADEKKPDSAKGRRDRSPSFPFIPLETAIERLTAFDSYFGRHPASADKIGLAWGGMKEKSSQGYQTLAALIAFGLLADQGSGPDRTASIADDGRTFLRAQQESIRNDVLRKAALKPNQIAKLWKVWGVDRPPDPIALDELILKRKYTDSAALTFLKVYDDTIAYAKLGVSDNMTEKEDVDGGGDDDSSDDEGARAKVGDFVQWISGGSNQFQIPRRVNWVSDDGSYVRVHGNHTGIKMSEVTVVDPPAPPPVGVESKGRTVPASGKDDTNDINVLLTGKRLQITADVDDEGIKRLKQMLTKYEEILKLLK